MWNTITNQSEISELFECFGNFRKSCITEIKYISGAYIGTNSDHFVNDNLTLSVVLQRRSLGEASTIELRFSGISEFKLSPAGIGYECYLDSAGIKIENHKIHWCSNEEFDDFSCSSGMAYIIAGGLMWRDISELVHGNITA